jgi:hypothetical protein
VSKRLVELSWKILEHKFMYYVLKRSIIADESYDLLAMEYRNLCKQENVSPTADDMVGFDFDKASCRLVAEKMGKLHGYPAPLPAPINMEDLI